MYKFMRVSAFMLAGIALSLLSACQVPFKKPSPPVKAPAPQVVMPVKAPETKEQLALRLILLNAEYTLAHDQLLTPANDNALMYYRQALALDPNNARAKGGLLGIVMRYVDLARQAAARGNYSQATAMLNSARMVDPSNLLIKEVADGLREQIKESPPLAAYKGGANEYLLDGASLSAQNAQISARIGEIARKLKATDSFALIVARTDPEGRWIYQQMRAAVPGYLVRGDIKLGSPPRVQLTPRQ